MDIGAFFYKHNKTKTIYILQHWLHDDTCDLVQFLWCDQWNKITLLVAYWHYYMQST